MTLTRNIDSAQSSKAPIFNPLYHPRVNNMISVIYFIPAGIKKRNRMKIYISIRPVYFLKNFSLKTKKVPMSAGRIRFMNQRKVDAANTATGRSAGPPPNLLK